MSGTRTSLSGWLARMGFADVPRAERELAALGLAGDDHPLLAALAQAPDPDLALAGLAQVAERDKSLIGALTKDPAFRSRLIAVLGVSRALADHLARHPADSAVLRGRDADRRPEPRQIRADLLRAVGADPGDRVPVAAVGDAATDPAALIAAAYRRGVLHLAARDLTGVITIDEAAAELADLADAVLDSALAVARAELPAEHRAEAAAARLAIVAMGKCGARELNYASDVDVIFVAEPADEQTSEEAALSAATRLAAGTIRVCERTTPEGAIFPVDPNLRPEGRQGPLVRTLASHLAYYDRWAKTWEFQALLKARPAAGDRDLGERYAKAVAPLVWHASQRENFVEDVQAMRRRVVATLPKNMAGRELKLGPGGLRDIEFAVQLLQLVHGSADDRLRVPATLPALTALADGGYVGRADADDLAQAYRFLRQTEHLLQIYQLRRTHTLPTDPAVLRRLGRAMRKSNSANPVFPNGPLAPPGPARPLPGRAQPGIGPSPGPAQPAASYPAPGESPDFRPPGPGLLSRRTPAGAAARGGRRGPGGGVHAGLDQARPAGPAAAREAVLPPAARRGGQAPVRRGPAHPGRGPGPPRGPRLPRPGRRAAAHRGADLGPAPSRGDPADAAACAARLVRRRGRTGRRAARVPPGQRGPGRDPVVPAAAQGRDQGGRADRHRARLEPVRDRPAAARAGSGRDLRRRRRARPQDGGRAAGRDDGRRQAPRRRPGPRHTRPDRHP